MNWFYLEHTINHQTDFWVEWLDAEGKGHPNVDQWDATIDIEQTTGVLGLQQDSEDKPSSSFAFSILEGDPLDEGVWSAKIHFGRKDNTGANYCYARGIVKVISEDPA